jgi:hypothetical protein
MPVSDDHRSEAMAITPSRPRSRTMNEHDVFIANERRPAVVRAVIEAALGAAFTPGQGPEPATFLAIGATMVFFHDSHPFEDDTGFPVTRYRYWANIHDTTRNTERQLATARRVFDAVTAEGSSAMLSYGAQGNLAIYPQHQPKPPPPHAEARRNTAMPRGHRYESRHPSRPTAVRKRRLDAHVTAGRQVIAGRRPACLVRIGRLRRWRGVAVRDAQVVAGGDHQTEVGQASGSNLKILLERPAGRDHLVTLARHVIDLQDHLDARRQPPSGGAPDRPPGHPRSGPRPASSPRSRQCARP